MPSFDEESVKPFLPVWSPSANEPVWDCKWIGNDYTYAALKYADDSASYFLLLFLTLSYFERKIDLENSLKERMRFCSL